MWACGNRHCNRYGVALAVDVGPCRCCSLPVSAAAELLGGIHEVEGPGHDERGRRVLERWSVLDRWWTPSPVRREFREVEEDGRRVTEKREEGGEWELVPLSGGDA